MEITIKKPSGNVIINSQEIEELIVEQLKTVPGIVYLGRHGIVAKVGSLFSQNQRKSVKVYPLENGELGISCQIKVVSEINFTDVSRQAQEIIKFSIEKKYGITVNHVDIIVQGFEKE